MTTHHSLAPQSPFVFTPSPVLEVPSPTPICVPSLVLEVPSPTPFVAALAELSDNALLSQLSILVKRDRELTVELLLHLSEVEVRKLHCAKGFSSLFMYCVRQLGFSEGVAFKRVGAARLGRRFPLALELLAKGELHLSALMLIGPHLAVENHREWLTAACKKTKREVEQLIATRCPKPDIASSVRKLPERNAAGGGAGGGAGTGGGAGALRAVATILPPSSAGDHPATAPGVVVEPVVETDIGSSAVEVTGSPLSGADCHLHEAQITESPLLSTNSHLPEAEPAECGIPAAGGAMRGAGTSIRHDARARVEPLSASSYSVAFTASETLKQKLERASDLVSHSVAPGNLPALIERAIDLLILTEEKRRFAVRTPAGSSTKAKRSFMQRSTPTQQDPDLVASTTHPETSAPGDEAKASARESQIKTAPNREQERSRSLAAELSRYVPAAVRRAVWERDGGQCTFLDEAGNRCSERSFLQIEHNTPHARGGPTTVGNCCLRCRAHNAYAADRVFGKSFMERAIVRSKSQRCYQTGTIIPP